MVNRYIHIPIIFFVLLAIGCQKEQRWTGDYELDVRVNASNGSLISLELGNTNEVYQANVKDGHAIFKGFLQEPTAAIVNVPIYGEYHIYLDPAKISLNIESPKSYHLKGSTPYDDKERYRIFLGDLMDRSILLKREVVQMGDESLKEKAIIADSLSRVSEVTFASKNINSYYSLVLLNSYLKKQGPYIDQKIYDEIKKTYDSFYPILKNSTKIGISIKNILAENDKNFLINK